MWNDKQLGTILAALVPQIAVGPSLSYEGRGDLLRPTLAQFANLLTREDQIKRLNLDILMHTRSEDARIRLLAMKCAVQAWTSAGSVLARECLFSPL